jgi:hypothetical protein
MGNQLSAAPVARNMNVRKVAPRFRSAQGRYVISNREYVGVIISGSTAALQLYNCDSYPVQPGLPNMFPWLSQVATTHQKYKFTKLVFTYVPVASTSTVGRVTLVYALDPLDPIPTSKTELFQYPTSTEGSVWSPTTLSVDCSKLLLLFTRGGFVADTDIKTYDAGQLFAASSNTAVASSVLGEIFVDYEVELVTPKPSICPSARLLITGFDAGNPFGDATPVYLNGSPWELEDATHVLFPSAGTFYITTKITIIPGTFGTFTMTIPVADGTATLDIQLASGTTQVTQYIIRVNNGPGRVTFVFGGAWAGEQLMFLKITQIQSIEQSLIIP